MRYIDAEDGYQLCLSNATMVLFRDSTTQNSLTVQEINEVDINETQLKRTVHHFSTSDHCVSVKSSASEMVSNWILPRDICPHTNIVNVYGYSYKYHLQLPPSKVTCVFFSRVESKHYISLASGNLNSSFTAEFYTSSSLNRMNGSARKCTTTESCSFSAMEPFFVRLTSGSEKIKTLFVSMISLQLPVLYSMCRVETVGKLGEFDINGNRMRSGDVSNEICVNPIDEIVSLGGYIAMIGLCFSVLMLGLHWAGFFSCMSLCWCKRDKLFRDLDASRTGMGSGIVNTDVEDKIVIEIPDEVSEETAEVETL